MILESAVCTPRVSWDLYAFVIYWSEFLLAAAPFSEQSFTFVLPPSVSFFSSTSFSICVFSFPSSYRAGRTRTEVRKHLHVCANKHTSTPAPHRTNLPDSCTITFKHVVAYVCIFIIIPYHLRLSLPLWGCYWFPTVFRYFLSMNT